MKTVIWVANLLFVISQTERCNGQQYDHPIVTDVYGNELPRWNRPPNSGNRPDNRQNVVRNRSPCENNPCQNSGTCTETGYATNPFVCECRPLYLGDLCEIVVKPPEKLTAELIGFENITIMWVPPNVTTQQIYGYIVQHNEFGDPTISKSEIISWWIQRYTITGLKEDTEYIVCINIVFNYDTIPTEAVLRDQCIEVKTKSSAMGSEILILIGVIGGVVIVALALLVVVLLVCCNRRKKGGEEEQKMSSFPSVSWRRTRKNYQDQSYLTNQDPDPRYRQDDVYQQNQTNNAIRSSYNDDVFAKRLSGQKPQYVNNHLLAVRSVSVTDHPSSIINPLKQEKRSHSSSSANVAALKQANRLSSGLSASYRELPPSISNHMMRSPTSRDKDATDEFDMGGSYLAPRHS